MGRSANQAGQPMAHGCQQPPASAGGLSWTVLSGLNLVLELHLVRLSLILCSDIFCHFMSGQSVLAIFILAQKHILHILELKCGLGIYLDKDACKKCKLS